VIVLDASAGVAALLHDGEARRMVGAASVHVPHLIDIEVISALRRRVAAGDLRNHDAHRAMEVWSGLGFIRYSTMPLRERVWTLRSAVTAYDALYVALAENLGCELVTADAKLAGANGMRCAITVVPR
jgi:predicted nucleic acid-binding protein